MEITSIKSHWTQLYLKAGADFVEGLIAWRLWWSMAVRDVRFRYRRSTLGPFWITVTTAIMISAMAHLYSGLFNQRLHNYFPFLTLGMLMFRFISDTISEGCNTFISAENYVRNTCAPLPIYPLNTVGKQFLMFVHNWPVYFVVALVFSMNPGLPGLMAIPGLVMVILNLCWIVVVLGIVSTRFRDIFPFVQSVLQIAFFMTPILWVPDHFETPPWFVNWNPIFHLIEIVRAPLLGEPISVTSWVVVSVLAILGWVATFHIYAVWRSKLAYWL